MKITESYLRQIVRETLLEEQNRIDESAKDAITKGLLALMMTHGVSNVVDIADNLSQEDVKEYQMHQSYSGSKNNSTSKANKEIDDALSQYHRARSMSTSGSAAQASGKKQRKRKAINNAIKKLKSLGISDVEKTYEEWKEKTSGSDGLRSINW